MDLQDKVAIVTGSGRGIGRAIAVELAGAGMRLVLAARSAEQIESVANEIRDAGGRAVAQPTDVTDQAGTEALTARALEEFGQVDVLINNAGRFHAVGALWEIDPEDWWQDVTVNLRGAMLCARAVLPHMIERDSGVVINLSGGGAAWPMPGGSAYGSSKAALMRVTDTLTGELEKRGSAVQCLAVGPGLVETEMTRYQADNPEGREWLPLIAERLQSGETRPPEDCARLVRRLLELLPRPELNGRIFNVETDMDWVEQNLEAIRKKDLFQIRSRAR